MKEFPGTHSPARGGRSSSTTPDFAGKERGERRGVMFSEEFLSPLRGSGETGNPSFPGAYATGLMPAALRAGGQKMCVILWVENPRLVNIRPSRAGKDLCRAPRHVSFLHAPRPP